MDNDPFQVDPSNLPKPQDNTSQSWYQPLADFMSSVKQDVITTITPTPKAPKPAPPSAEQKHKDAEKAGYYGIDDAVTKGVIQRDKLDPAMPGAMVGINTQRDMGKALQGDNLAFTGFDASRVLPGNAANDTKHKNNFGEYEPYSDAIHLNTDPNMLVPGDYISTLAHEGRHRAIAQSGSKHEQVIDMINGLVNRTNKNFGEESLVRVGDILHGGRYSQEQGKDHLSGQLQSGSYMKPADQNKQVEDLKTTYKMLEGLFTPQRIGGRHDQD